MRIIPMTEKYIKQAEVFEQLKRKEIPQKGAALLLSLSPRHIRRKLKRFLEYGAESLVHGNKGRPSNKRLSSDIRAKIIELMKTKYEGFGPTFASEKMAELDGIIIHPETLRLFLIYEGLWHKQRKRKRHRKWRKPKDFFGEMIQVDGSIHVWVDGQKWTLLRFVDDATKMILWMEFVKSESWKSITRATINYFSRHGMPVSLYTDRGKVFKVNLNNEENEFITQYQRALNQLGVKLIHAYSPQAKGRVERGFQTDQDRLIKELKLAGIKTMDEANKFLQEYYIPKMNNKFAIPATKEGNLHRKVGKYNLDDIFCIQAIRTVQNDWVVRYNNRFFQIDNLRPAIVKPKDQVTIHERLDGTIFISIRSITLEFKEIKERIRYVKQPEKVYTNKIYKPKPDHPWRVYPTCY